MENHIEYKGAHVAWIGLWNNTPWLAKVVAIKIVALTAGLIVWGIVRKK